MSHGGLNTQVVSRKIVFLIYDIFSVIMASGLALLLRFEFSFDKVETQYIDMMWRMLPAAVVITIAFFWIFRLYNSVWSFAGMIEMRNIILASILATTVCAVLMYGSDNNMFRSYYILYLGVQVVITTIGRFAYRLYRRIVNKGREQGRVRNTMVIGAGEAGDVIIRELKHSSYLRSNIRCVIDDNPYKWGKYINGVKIVGGRERIVEFAEKYNIDEIIIAIPSAKKSEISEITSICKDITCELKILPGVFQLINGDVSVSKLRNVEVEDLLGRDPVEVNVDSILEYVQGKVILVTGGGGSIGSELCRQIASHNPKKLIIFDIYENNAYEIKNELNRKYPELDLEVLIGSVRNTNRINFVFEKYRPDIVYHAAAHKHVPLMEDSPNEAIKNNVFGTLKTVQAADKYGTKRFVLISTDKAVNPTNIMGASKRMCEMIVQAYNNRSKTDYVAVRFGNVLGSNGSVIPLFKKQILAGGPVTVTHPDIIRYFMTIPEAVSLVLQAGANAKGGEIFVLDMGKPVKILDLAKNLIRLSGYVPDEDIKIEFSGLRPGEKLYEELLMEEEGLQDTDNKRIHIGKPICFDENELMKQLAELEELIRDEHVDVRDVVKNIVPTYHR